MIIEELQSARAQIEAALLAYRFELESLAPGRLAVTQKDGATYYFQEVRTEGGRSRVGISKNEELIHELARKEYLQKAIPELEANLRVIDRALAGYRPTKPQDIVAQLSAKAGKVPERYYVNALTDWVVLNLDAQEQERIARHRAWGAQPYAAPAYKVEGRTMVTSRGEYMRSKAEVLIAEKLYEYGIPFRYEQELDLGSEEMLLHPDFTFEAADGSEFYLEFCGKMDDERYVAAHKAKVAAYNAAGIVPWKNIIYVYASGNDIDMRRIESVVRTQVIPWL